MKPEVLIDVSRYRGGQWRLSCVVVEGEEHDLEQGRFQSALSKRRASNTGRRGQQYRTDEAAVFVTEIRPGRKGKLEVFVRVSWSYDECKRDIERIVMTVRINRVQSSKIISASFSAYQTLILSRYVQTS
jgi:hypothetical protein